MASCFERGTAGVCKVRHVHLRVCARWSAGVWEEVLESPFMHTFQTKKRTKLSLLILNTQLDTGALTWSICQMATVRSQGLLREEWMLQNVERLTMAPSLVHSLEIVYDVLQFICVWLSGFEHYMIYFQLNQCSQNRQVS